MVGRPMGEATNHLEIWTLRVDRIAEPDILPLQAILDDHERARAARFGFAHGRVQYIAAHALTRLALGRLLSADPASLRFVEGSHGKPAAWLDGRPAAVSFNLSHTVGMVGIAVSPQAGVAVGFDIEPIDRRVRLALADRYFRPEEVAWIASLDPTQRQHGFLRLWTLKEALIKATGEGLARDLASFWFEVFPPRLHLVAPAGLPTDGWQFEQRIVEASFVAAAGLRSASGSACRQVWRVVDPARLLSGSPDW
jgi:4'-phosphopantetheinyl transferase